MGSGPGLPSPDPRCTDPGTAARAAGAHATGARGNVAAALTLLAALQRCGLRHLVLCPGSRSAPLAVAAALLEPRGLRLHTAIDERSAAFFALGLGRAQGQPAAVVTTSGTAVAQLLAAAVEADLGTIPLLLLSADRPQRLKNCGANQAVPQERFLLACSRTLLEGPPAGLASATAQQLEDLAAAAFAAASGDGRTAPAGPVHLNLPFEEPLHADGADLAALAAWAPANPASSPADAPPAAADAPADGSAAVPVATAGLTSVARVDPTLAPPPDPPAAAGQAAAVAAIPRLDPDQPGVVVAGPWRGKPQDWSGHVEALRRWQQRSGWPVLADVLSGLRGLEDLQVVAAYDPLLSDPDAVPAVRQVLRLGSLPASRRLQTWLERCGARQLLVSQGDPRRLDPLGVVADADQWSGGLAAWVEAVIVPVAALPGAAVVSPPSRALAGRWQQLEQAAQRALERELSGSPEAPGVARAAAGRANAAVRPGEANDACARGGSDASGGSVGAAGDGGASACAPGREPHHESAASPAPDPRRGSGGETTPARGGQGCGPDSDRGVAGGIADGAWARPEADGRVAEASRDHSREAGWDASRAGHRGANREEHRADSCEASHASSADHRRAADPPLSEPWLARALSHLLPPGLPVMLASSSPVRDWESFAAAEAPWRPVHGFRGASGIDGTLSIACGLAEALGQLVLVSGDLALLHDANGWLWARQLRGRLTVVLIENGGGGIFEQLPIRTQPAERLDFERLFAMPQPIDQLALAGLHGVPGRRLRRAADLPGDLAWALEQPFALLELRSHRQQDAALRQRLRQAACAAASGSAGRMAGPDPERR